MPKDFQKTKINKHHIFFLKKGYLPVQCFAGSNEIFRHFSFEWYLLRISVNRLNFGDPNFTVEKAQHPLKILFLEEDFLLPLSLAPYNQADGYSTLQLLQISSALYNIWQEKTKIQLC